MDEGAVSLRLWNKKKKGHPDGVALFASTKFGIHHIAFAVGDLKAEVQRLKAAGFVFVSEEPKRGADNKWVVFMHPKSAGGVLVELCQEINPD